jgi:hypothetical protein
MNPKLRCGFVTQVEDKGWCGHVLVGASLMARLVSRFHSTVSLTVPGFKPNA